MRWYRSQGRHVVLVGDLNISPTPADRADPDPDHYARADRRWMRSLAGEDGDFCDVFRHFHPTRCSAAGPGAPKDRPETGVQFSFSE